MNTTVSLQLVVACGTASQTQSAMQSFFSRSHDAVIRVYDEAGNVIEAHEHAGELSLRRDSYFRFQRE